MSLSPTRMEYGAYPSEKISGTLMFVNRENRDLLVSFEPEDFTPLDEGGHATIANKDNQRSLKDWIVMEQPVMSVTSGYTIKPAYDIIVPANASPGTYWGTIVARANPSESGEGSAIESNIGSIFLLQVYGEAQELLSLAGFEAPEFVEYTPINFTVRFKNDGTVHLKPKGVIEIGNIFGKTAETLQLPEENVLPGYTRRWDIATGKFLFLGRYTATLHVSYGSNNQIIEAKKIIWVVPWRILWLPVFLIIAVGWLIKCKYKDVWKAITVLFKGEEP